MGKSLVAFKKQKCILQKVWSLNVQNQGITRFELHPDCSREPFHASPSCWYSWLVAIQLQFLLHGPMDFFSLCLLLGPQLLDGPTLMQDDHL